MPAIHAFIQNISFALTEHDNLQKRSLTSWNVCHKLTVDDDGNNQRDHPRDPSDHRTWWGAPEWWQWLNATCTRPGYSPDFKVWCKKLRHAGQPIQNGVELNIAGICPPRKVCMPKWSGVDGRREHGRFADVSCARFDESKAQRVLKGKKPKKWCSLAQILGIPKLKQRASYEVVIDASSSVPGAVDGTELWFEVYADWWKYGHRFADSPGPVTSGVINTNPALGQTSVKFCAQFSADTIHAQLPWVGLVYAASLITQRYRPGIGDTIGDITESIEVLDVEQEPRGAIVDPPW